MSVLLRICGPLNSLTVALSLTIRSLAFSLYEEKCPFLSRKRTVVVMNRGQRVNMAKKSKRHTGGFILKKSPEAWQKRSPAPLYGVVLGLFWLQRFSAGEAMCCLQIALSHFAAWRGNVLFRKISRTEAYVCSNKPPPSTKNIPIPKNRDEKSRLLK